ITDVNEEMARLTGRPREELIGSPFKDYFTDTARAEEGIRLVLRDTKVTNYELTARAKDGRNTVVSYNASTFYDRDGKLQGVFAAARDITEQKTLEQQLRETQAYNRGLIESSVDGLITVDPEGLISDVNERMCLLSGYPREELIGTAFSEYFLDAERASDGVRETFTRGVVTDYVLALRVRDGGERQVSFNASVFEGPDGGIQGIFASARDITEQAVLQRQLAEERAYNRGLIEASLDALITVDPLLVISDVNETMCRLTGYTREELIGSAFQDYFTDPKAASKGVRLTFDRGSASNYELTLRTRTGEERLVSFNAAVFKDEEDVVRGIFASARDVTEQAALQQQLADERAYNRGLIEASVDGLLTVDAEMTITDVNETMCRMAGRSRAQLIGSRFADHFSERELAERGVALTFEAGSVTNYVLTLVSATGAEVPVSFNAATFRDTNGEVRGVFASARDISEQKTLEERASDSQFYTRSLIESNVDALMTTDSLGVITDVNQEMEALTGSTREELIGSLFKDYFTDPKRAEDGIRRVLRDGKVTNYELTARAANGLETVVSYNASTFYDRDGSLQGVFAAARDVTARKQGEVELQDANAELERANLSKDRFLASMSHELRTPLNSIIGFTGAMLLGYSGPLTDEQHKQVETVQASGKHLLSLINDLLDLAKVESGKLDLEPERLAAAEAVDEIVRTLGGLATEKGLPLTVAVPEDLHVRADRRALTQILLNLTSNAIKFTETGSIKITARRAPKSGRVVITVTDTGSGIPTEDQVKLFQAFEQGGSSATRRHDGTGLGLYISQKLATSLGGDIACQSTPGKGSRFMLTLEEA
ncbi:MAG: PAS domain S-box protein, partial [Acidobacteriota bacterium]|nr:PAS domain S-box protein [Acidobacteriota bacterium]